MIIVVILYYIILYIFNYLVKSSLLRLPHHSKVHSQNMCTGGFKLHITIV